MRGLRSVAALTVCLVSVGLLLAGCGARGTQQVASSIQEQGITQAEAQVMWDGLAKAYGGEKDWRNRRSQIETATLAAFDVRALMDSAWAEDIGNRVLTVNPDVMKDNTGEGQFPGYMEAKEALRNDMRGALSGASDADLIADAWTVWGTVEGEDAEYRIPNLPWQAFSVLTDAVVRPSTAATRVVSVEGTDNVLVTYKTRFTWSADGDYNADWTNHYTVEKRDGKWVITGITNLGDYAVAVAESDLKRAKDAAGKPKVKPSDAEVKKAFGGEVRVPWMGADAAGRWWVIVSHPVAPGEVYRELGYRDEGGSWRKGGKGAADQFVQIPKSWIGLVPPEVIAAAKKEGFTFVDGAGKTY